MGERERVEIGAIRAVARNVRLWLWTACLVCMPSCPECVRMVCGDLSGDPKWALAVAGLRSRGPDEECVSMCGVVVTSVRCIVCGVRSRRAETSFFDL